MIERSPQAAASDASPIFVQRLDDVLRLCKQPAVEGGGEEGPEACPQGGDLSQRHLGFSRADLLAAVIGEQSGSA